MESLSKITGPLLKEWRNFYNENSTNDELTSIIDPKDLADTNAGIVYLHEVAENLPKKGKHSRLYNIALHSSILFTMNARKFMDQIVPGNYQSIKTVSQNVAQALSQLSILFCNALKAEKEKLYSSLDRSVTIEKKQYEEVNQKLNSLNAAYKDRETQIDEMLDALSGVEELKKSLEKAKKTLNDIDEAGRAYNKNDIDQHKSDISQNLSDSKELVEKIKSILADASTAKLAESASNRKNELKTGKLWWLLGFILAIAGLSAMTICSILFKWYDSVPIWEKIYFKFSTYSPLIWLGWFFARQYGHSTRLQEVYAHKDVSARAFYGYKELFEEIAKEEIKDKKMLENLSELALEIVKINPSKVFDRNSNDEIPKQAGIDESSANPDA